MKIAFEEHGEGFPVVLIHAFPLSRRMWAKQIEPLASQGFRVILPDLFGFGETSIADNVNSLEEFAAEIKNLLDSLSIEKAVIGGLSMGGYVTFNFYRMFPEKCAALILADTSSAKDTEEKRSARITMIEKINRLGVGVLVEDMLPNLVSDETKKENPSLVESLAQEFCNASAEGVVKALKAMAERKDHNSLLKTVTIPAALIFGEKDNVTSLDNAETMRAEMPNAKLFVIEKSGHYSNLEQPQEFNRVLLEFLASVKNDAQK